MAAGVDDSRMAKEQSGLFQTEPSANEESTSLKIALIILMLCFLLELILMFVKSPFISCLAYIFVFGIYLLNYFDRSYVKVCLWALLVSVIFDLVWLIVLAGVSLHRLSPTSTTPAATAPASREVSSVSHGS
jgi:uncharacterized membrane protein